MADFEVMPIGSRSLLVESASLLRIYEGWQRERADDVEVRGKGTRAVRAARLDEAANLAEVAGRIETLLQLGNGAMQRPTTTESRDV